MSAAGDGAGQGVALAPDPPLGRDEQPTQLASGRPHHDHPSLVMAHPVTPDDGDDDDDHASASASASGTARHTSRGMLAADDGDHDKMDMPASISNSSSSDGPLSPGRGSRPHPADLVSPDNPDPHQQYSHHHHQQTSYGQHQQQQRARYDSNSYASEASSSAHTHGSSSTSRAVEQLSYETHEPGQGDDMQASDDAGRDPSGTMGSRLSSRGTRPATDQDDDGMDSVGHSSPPSKTRTHQHSRMPSYRSWTSSTRSTPLSEEIHSLAMQMSDTHPFNMDMSSTSSSSHVDDATAAAAAAAQNGNGSISQQSSPVALPAAGMTRSDSSASSAQATVNAPAATTPPSSSSHQNSTRVGSPTTAGDAQDGSRDAGPAGSPLQQSREPSRTGDTVTESEGSNFRPLPLSEMAEGGYTHKEQLALAAGAAARQMPARADIHPHTHFAPSAVPDKEPPERLSRGASRTTGADSLSRNGSTRSDCSTDKSTYHLARSNSLMSASSHRSGKHQETMTQDPHLDPLVEGHQAPSSAASSRPPRSPQRNGALTSRQDEAMEEVLAGPLPSDQSAGQAHRPFDPADQQHTHHTASSQSPPRGRSLNGSQEASNDGSIGPTEHSFSSAADNGHEGPRRADPLNTLSEVISTNATVDNGPTTHPLPTSLQGAVANGTTNSASQPAGTTARVSRPTSSSAAEQAARASESRRGSAVPSSGVSTGEGRSAPRDKEREKEREREKDRERSSRRQLGEWTLGKTLGAGSMGKVKVGVSTVTGEKVAIKIIPRHTSTAAAHQQAAAQAARDQSGKNETNGQTSAQPSKSFLEKAMAKDLSKEIRTIREGSMCMLLHHPYVCGQKSMLVYPNHYYMITEYVNGGQLLDYIISHGRLRERSARKFARQICSALEYCHANNIVHRDLKIENILISKTGNIKIIDFGLSNLYSPHSHLSTFCGSLYFAAPELLNAKVYTGPEVDVWSFGIVLYVLVCGKVPFDDQSMPALHAKIKRGQVDYPPWLSTECRNLLMRMLVTTPANRAALLEVASHPWMVKGYDGPPASHLPKREPIRFGELDMEVIKGMTGFEFGTPEEIEMKMNDVLTTDQYLAALAHWDEQKNRSSSSMLQASQRDYLGTSPPSQDAKAKSPNKRFSGLGFYGKRLAGNVAAAFSARNDDTDGEHSIASAKAAMPVTVGAGGVRTDLTDPTRAYHPLLSIYFLVKEKMERDRIYGPGVFASSSLSVDGPPAPPASGQAAIAPAKAAAQTNGATAKYNVPAPAIVLPPPAPAATTASRDARVLQPPTAARTRGATESDPAALPKIARPPPSAEDAFMQRSNSQTQRGSRRNPPVPISTPTSPQVMQGGFRRTAAPDPDARPLHSSTPPSHRHSVHLATTPVPVTVTAASPPQTANSGLPPEPATAPLSSSSSSANSFAKRFGSILGRSEDKKHARSRNSISVSSSHYMSPTKNKGQHPPSDSQDLDISLAVAQAGQGVNRASTTGSQLSPPHRHARGLTVDTTSSNAATHGTVTSPPKGSDRRRQASVSGTSSSRRPRAAATAAFGDPLPEENEIVDMAGDSQEETGDAAGSLDSKPVYLKGLFSVATTSTKSPAAIRESIVRVLDQLGVNHRAIKAGFECAHAPSIDLSSVAFSPRPETATERMAPFSSSPESPTLDRRRSSRRSTRIGLSISPFSKDKDLDKETSNPGGDRSESSLPRNHRSTTSSSSLTVLSNPSPSQPTTPARPVIDTHSLGPRSPSTVRQTEHPPSHPITDVSMPSDAHDMIVRFEIFIIKVPWLPGLHGIQFRRISGNAWQYSQLARTVLNELKL